MKYYLFSAIQRCQPCRVLVGMLDQKLPNWKNVVQYINVDHATEEQRELARKLGVMRIPAFGNDETLLPNPFGYIDIYKQIKELCTQG